MLKFLPNFITSFRIILSFIFIPFFLQEKFFESFIIFSVASISDFLDGYLARKFHVTSKLGAVLDPISDKLLVFISYFLFAKTNIISWYLFWIVFLRDFFIIGAVILCFSKKIDLKFRPLMSSKINTTIQLLFIILILSCKTFSINVPLSGLVFIVCCSTIYSGVDYVRKYKWIKNELFN